MKIIFLCGCLEPGQDGVGDYTRLLAAETIKQGHQCYIMALNDKFISETNHCVQNVDLQEVEVKRLASSYSIGERMRQAKLWMDELNPDWISIQFVIFSFHPKGLPFGLNKTLASLCQRRKVHFMFHELWVGISDDASKKHIVWGALQRHLISNLLSILKPNLISTQCELYSRLLEKLQVSAHLLPLFSNVPQKPLQSNGDFINEETKKVRNLSLIVFGTIHPSARLEELLTKVNSYIKKHNGTIACLTLIGRCGADEGKWIELCKASGLPIKVLGEQPTDIISKALGSSNIGISTSALPMIDKSGTVAAMIEHNLPVICVGHQWKPRGLKSPIVPNGIFDVSEKDCLEMCLNYTKPSTNKRTVADVAENLIKKLMTIN